MAAFRSAMPNLPSTSGEQTQMQTQEPALQLPTGQPIPLSTITPAALPLMEPQNTLGQSHIRERIPPAFSSQASTSRPISMPQTVDVAELLDPDIDPALHMPHCGSIEDMRRSELEAAISARNSHSHVVEDPGGVGETGRR